MVKREAARERSVWVERGVGEGQGRSDVLCSGTASTERERGGEGGGVREREGERQRERETE